MTRPADPIFCYGPVTSLLTRKHKRRGRIHKWITAPSPMSPTLSLRHPGSGEVNAAAATRLADAPPVTAHSPLIRPSLHFLEAPTVRRSCANLIGGLRAWVVESRFLMEW